MIEFVIWWLGTFALWLVHCNHKNLKYDFAQSMFMLLTWPLWVLGAIVTLIVYYPPQSAILLWTFILLWML